ncbi:hypothetical protein FBD94_00735 [Pedobacter hiemivivus]|uniref:Uncharacterized protein n=1 Tax=Pedobacter hiemivivus TaxID=2530454 RepID=A0A4U1GLI9_9SPHI|nr:hypothetical protein [Pedobacter hiemivivus]TCC98396.1 hypothetical protein EZ444_03670 [Pedobacter hiemivivus]TKC65118.1 hypothetical protein FBD94_00735 [Pedobacter hiemivivus]
MEININEILLFKTNIRTEDDKKHIGKIMEEHKIGQWTVDLHDVDCVLRIVSPVLKHQDVITLVMKNGYTCEVLT